MYKLIRHKFLPALLLSLLSWQAVAAEIDFSQDIQPILSDNCYHCHGPDEGRRKANLRLDTAEGALGMIGRKQDHKAIVAGHPDQSSLIERIYSTDADDVMPPTDSNRKITDKQKALLKQWVSEGAKWGKHWAFVAPIRPALPNVEHVDWPVNPIDLFILAKLESLNIQPSSEASKETLIRRVTLDLTGIPPTPAEVDVFLADQSEHAYEDVVDRLLASPRYGERMVWEWLDAARYADTNGYQGDNTRTMWPWRDWAIEAMNNNMPFDQFTVMQLAGDLLPTTKDKERNRDQKLATGFLRNHMINGEGGRIAEENRIDYVMDQSETLGTVWLGLTMTCCRCHNHKFDAITLKDYYSLFAFFNRTAITGGGGNGQTAPVLDFADESQKAMLADLNIQVKKLSDELAAMEKEIFTFPEGKVISDSPKLAKASGSTALGLKTPPATRYLPSYRELLPLIKDEEPKYVAAAQHFLKTIDARNALSETVPRVMVMEDVAKPRDTFILVKGAYDKATTEKVDAAIPAVLGKLSDQKIDRLALANWLVSPGHPSTPGYNDPSYPLGARGR